MKIGLIVSITLIFLPLESTAINNSSTDTTGKKIRPRDAAFLEKYGTDDVSKTVILKYFSKRRVNKIIALSMLAAATLSGIGIINAESSSGSSWTVPFELLFLNSTLFLSGIAFLLCFGFLIFHSRRRLIKILDKYNETGKLPKKYKYLLQNSK